MDDRTNVVISEDPNAGYATPVMDLFAAGVLAAIAIWMMVESLRLPVPGAIDTAPGLLPFLTAASLLVMAVLLGSMAVRRRRETSAEANRLELPPDFRRSMGLGAILIVYVAGLDFVPVSASFEIGPLRFVVGAFEAVTIVALTAILALYWRKPLSICLVVSLGWVVFLSIVFRMIFHSPLP